MPTPASLACYVLSGGFGSRLWPLSRKDHPKQFHKLHGDESMLAATLRRAASRSHGTVHPHIIGSECHAARIADDIRAAGVRDVDVWLEPVGRNTAAAVAVATRHALRHYGDCPVLVLPSDHDIRPVAEFWRCIEAGLALAGGGAIVVFGVTPTRPETGFGYIELGTPVPAGGAGAVTRFVEKPPPEEAALYAASGIHFWNSGIFLFNAATMQSAFEALHPDIWAMAGTALDGARHGAHGHVLSRTAYENIASISVDHAIMERVPALHMVRASFAWSDLGSWQAIFDASRHDVENNVAVGDVLSLDCTGSYFRSDGPLVAATGVSDIAVVATQDAVFITPLARSQAARTIADALEARGRPETLAVPRGAPPVSLGYSHELTKTWLFNTALPLWSTAGVDRRYGGFHEALSLSGEPLGRPKRMRTMARQTYVFAQAKALRWAGPCDELIAHGLDFMQRGRTADGGWMRVLAPDGSPADRTEDSYDIAFVLLALAAAHQAGHAAAFGLMEDTIGFLDRRLADHDSGGFRNSTGDDIERQSNPHMHLLEAFLAWHAATGDGAFLDRAARIVELLRDRFFDPETWTLGEYFTRGWQRLPGERGALIEPGHHFEWVWLLTQYAAAAGRPDCLPLARKLMAFAAGSGINRKTGLAFGTVTPQGRPVTAETRSWPQAEALKAATGLWRAGETWRAPAIELQVELLFRHHLRRTPPGLWIDRIDESGRPAAADVPASILYHLVSALGEYIALTQDFVSTARVTAARM